MRAALKTAYAAEPCECGRGDACPGIAITDPASYDHKAIVKMTLVNIMRAAGDLQQCGLTAEEVCEGFASDAIKPGREPLTADDVARIARLADMFQVITNGFRAASELDFEMLNAQARIDPEVH